MVRTQNQMSCTLLVKSKKNKYHSIESIEMKVFFGVCKMGLKWNLINNQIQSINQTLDRNVFDISFVLALELEFMWKWSRWIRMAVLCVDKLNILNAVKNGAQFNIRCHKMMKWIDEIVDCCVTYAFWFVFEYIIAEWLLKQPSPTGSRLNWINYLYPPTTVQMKCYAEKKNYIEKYLSVTPCATPCAVSGYNCVCALEIVREI